MSVTRKVRPGEAVIGVSAANESDNNIAVYALEPGVRLVKATCSGGFSGGTISAAQLNGRLLCVVYVRQADTGDPINPTISGPNPSAQLLGTGAQRVIAAAWCGDTRFGQNPAEIPIDLIVQEGEQIVIEATSWRDSANTAGASQSILNLIAEKAAVEATNDSLALKVR